MITIIVETEPIHAEFFLLPENISEDNPFPGFLFFYLHVCVQFGIRESEVRIGIKGLPLT